MGRTRTEKQAARQDKVTLSQKGKAQSLLESLMKQKQSILDKRSKLMGDTLESGKPISSVQEQLDAYEEQIKELDEQIAQSMEGKPAGKDEERQRHSSNAGEADGERFEGRTKDELRMEKLAAAVEFKGDLDSMETLDRVKNQLEGRRRIMMSELSQDGAAGGATPEKRSRAAGLEARIEAVSGSQSELMDKVNQNVGAAAEDRPGDGAIDEQQRSPLLEDEQE